MPSKNSTSCDSQRRPGDELFDLLEEQLSEEPSSEGLEHQPAVLEILESLDDVMFAAIDADPNALEAARNMWQEVVNQLGADEVEETRQQYLRRAKGVWEELRSMPEYPPHRLFAALEVIALLAHQADS